jgi:hypothetical protein
VLKSGRAYDCIPNFTAADIVRLLGIGRNQYIEIVNRFRCTRTCTHRRSLARSLATHARGCACRSKGWLKKLRGRSIFDELPSHPVEGHIEYWWRVQPAHVSPEEFKKCARLGHLESPLPHLRQDWSPLPHLREDCHVWPRTGLAAAASAPGLGQVWSAAAGNDLNNSRESLAPRRRRRGGALGPDDSAPAVLQGAGVRGGAESTVRTAAQLSQAAHLSRAAQLSHAAWYHTAWYLAAQLSSGHSAQLSSGHSAARHGCAMSAARRCRSTTMTRSRSRRCRTSS